MRREGLLRLWDIVLSVATWPSLTRYTFLDFDNFLTNYFSHSFAHWFNTAGCSNQNCFFLLLIYILRRLFPVIVLRTRCHVTRFRTFVSVKKKKINFDNTGKQPLQWDWVWEGWWRFGRKETQKLPGSFFVRGFWNKKDPAQAPSGGVRPAQQPRREPTSRAGFSKTFLELKTSSIWQVSKVLHDKLQLPLISPLPCRCSHGCCRFSHKRGEPGLWTTTSSGWPG